MDMLLYAIDEFLEGKGRKYDNRHSQLPQDTVFRDVGQKFTAAHFEVKMAEMGSTKSPVGHLKKDRNVLKLDGSSDAISAPGRVSSSAICEKSAVIGTPSCKVALVSGKSSPNSSGRLPLQTGLGSSSSRQVSAPQATKCRVGRADCVDRQVEKLTQQGATESRCGEADVDKEKVAKTQQATKGRCGRAVCADHHVAKLWQATKMRCGWACVDQHVAKIWQANKSHFGWACVDRQVGKLKPSPDERSRHDSDDCSVGCPAFSTHRLSIRDGVLNECPPVQTSPASESNSADKDVALAFHHPLQFFFFSSFSFAFDFESSLLFLELLHLASVISLLARLMKVFQKYAAVADDIPSHRPPPLPDPPDNGIHPKTVRSNRVFRGSGDDATDEPHNFVFVIRLSKFYTDVVPPRPSSLPDPMDFAIDLRFGVSSQPPSLQHSSTSINKIVFNTNSVEVFDVARAAECSNGLVPRLPPSPDPPDPATPVFRGKFTCSKICSQDDIVAPNILHLVFIVSSLSKYRKMKDNKTTCTAGPSYHGVLSRPPLLPKPPNLTTSGSITPPNGHSIAAFVTLTARAIALQHGVYTSVFILSDTEFQLQFEYGNSTMPSSSTILDVSEGVAHVLFSFGKRIIFPSFIWKTFIILRGRKGPLGNTGTVCHDTSSLRDGSLPIIITDADNESSASAIHHSSSVSSSTTSTNTNFNSDQNINSFTKSTNNNNSTYNGLLSTSFLHSFLISFIVVVNSTLFTILNIIYCLFIATSQVWSTIALSCATKCYDIILTRPPPLPDPSNCNLSAATTAASCHSYYQLQREYSFRGRFELMIFFLFCFDTKIELSFRELLGVSDGAAHFPFVFGKRINIFHCTAANIDHLEREYRRSNVLCVSSVLQLRSLARHISECFRNLPFEKHYSYSTYFSS